MNNPKPYYERNPVIDSEINVRFEDLLDMDREEFSKWLFDLRKAVKKAWDEVGTPCRTGSCEADMIRSFDKLSSLEVARFTHSDELTPDEKDTVIINTGHHGSEVDQFFSNMMKVPMCYGIDNKGYSVYDLFADDSFQERMAKGEWRHFRKDSFYHYSATVRVNDPEFPFHTAKTGSEWITLAHGNTVEMNNKEYWIQEMETSDELSTGYIQVKQSDFLQVTYDEVIRLYDAGLIPTRAIANAQSIIDRAPKAKPTHYVIRLYELGQRILPIGWKSFRIGYISVPVNFPPMTAKYLYERYTSHLVGKQDKITIYDPSCGWGGRVLGAMSVNPNRIVHYVGTDPNPDNIWPVTGLTKYEEIVKFFNANTTRGMDPFGDVPPNTAHIFREGSEDIGKHPDFQQYKGKVDLIFTSPPYFNRELYSTDPKQSAVKFGSSYESWRDGFLKPTLQTCYEWLAPDRYLLWNIADVLIGDEYLPLEKDSRDTLEALGMVPLTILKMVVASMPGGQRLDENGIPKCKNYVKVKGKFLKHEPIFVFKKRG